MTIKQIIQELAPYRGVDSRVRFSTGFHPGRVDSWRGIYSEPAVEIVDIAPSIDAFLKELQLAISEYSTYQGYKGGSYQFNEDQELRVDNWGDYSGDRRISAVRVDLMNGIATATLTIETEF